jgi:hypothetical protein
MENIVFLQLSRKSGDIFYYKTQDGKETDFYLPESKELIQVTQNMNNESTYQREIGSLLASMEELNINEGLIITEELEKEIVENGKKIDILPLYKFLSLS